jgi:hypothetical protein
VLGIKLPIWKILGPAVFLHGMANFRGMKVSMLSSLTFVLNSCDCGSELVVLNLRRYYLIANIQMEFIYSMVRNATKSTETRR